MLLQLSFWYGFTFTLLSVLQTDAISLKVLRRSHGHGDGDHDHQHQIHDHRSEICELPHYGEDPEYTGKLAVMEDKLAEKLGALFPELKEKSSSVFKERKKQSLCQQYLSKYLKEHADDKATMEKIIEELDYLTKHELVTVNPIFSVKLLRRMVITLITKTMKECRDPSEVVVKETVESSFKQAGLVLPTVKEMRRSFRGLVFTTFLYRVNVSSDLRQGIVRNLPTKSKLTFEDCLEIANTVVLEDNEGVMTYNWLMAAEGALASEGDNTQAEQRTELDLAWKGLLPVVGVQSMSRLHSKMGGRFVERWDGVSFRSESLCRTEVDNIPPNHQHWKLKCFYNRDRHPYFYLNPLKVEVVSKKPLLLQFYEFLTESEIRYIRYESPVRVLPRAAFGKEENATNDKEAEEALEAKMIQMILEKNRNPVLVNLVRKIEMTTKLEVPKENASAIYSAIFSPLSQFASVAQFRNQPVHDFWSKLRFASFHLHLTESVMGVSAYPRLNVFIEPELGSAALSVNENANGEYNEQMMLESCPVLLGTKEVASIQLEKGATGKVDLFFRKNKISFDKP